MADYKFKFIHFTCIGVAPPQLVKPFACSVTIQGVATQLEAKWIKLDQVIINIISYNLIVVICFHLVA